MASSRNFDLVAFDMDGVLVDCESTWVWIHDHFGVNNDTSLREFMRGNIDDMEFMRRDISLWKAKDKGLTIQDIEDILTPLPIMEGVEETVARLREQGTRSVIISGGLDIVARRLHGEYGFDGWIANGVEADERGRLTGEGVLRVELTDKQKALQRFRERWAVSPDKVAAVGNSFVDVSMFKGCGLSIAYNPIDEEVRNQADTVVNSEDLRSILPLIIEKNHLEKP